MTLTTVSGQEERGGAADQERGKGGQVSLSPPDLAC